jgi:predicted nucleic acid-binding protein
VKFLDAVESDAYEVVRVRRDDELNAIALVRAHQDKMYSLCDALRFVVMERLRIREAIAFDQDFRSYGQFAVL